MNTGNTCNGSKRNSGIPQQSVLCCAQCLCQPCGLLYALWCTQKWTPPLLRWPILMWWLPAAIRLRSPCHTLFDNHDKDECHNGYAGPQWWDDCLQPYVYVHHVTLCLPITTKLKATTVAVAHTNVMTACSHTFTFTVSHFVWRRPRQ